MKGPPPDQPLSPLLTSREAASILGITERTLRTYARRGEIPVVRLGSSVRFDPHDLRAFIDRAKHCAGQELREHDLKHRSIRA